MLNENIYIGDYNLYIICYVESIKVLEKKKFTTIQITVDVRDQLKVLRKYYRETYNDILKRAIELLEKETKHA